MIAFASWLFALAAATSLPTAKGLHQLQADIPEVGRVRYAISIPDGYDPTKPIPLVLVLHHGAVAELGTHEELLAMQGLYYTLHTLQFQDISTDEADAIAGERGVS